MVTTIGSKQRPPHLYLTEWRDHFGYSAQKVADRVETSRETIWRWENEQHRLNPEKIGLYAAALGIEPEQLFFPPGRESADSHLKKLPQARFEEAIDIVKRLSR